MLASVQTYMYSVPKLNCPFLKLKIYKNQQNKNLTFKIGPKRKFHSLKLAKLKLEQFGSLKFIKIEIFGPSHLNH